MNCPCERCQAAACHRNGVRIDEQSAAAARVMDCAPEESPAALAQEQAAKDGLGAVTGWAPPYHNVLPAAGTPAKAPRAAELVTLHDRRRVYIEYARHRIDDGDWHGVSDAANDLRELDVEIRMLEAAKP